MSGSAGWRFWLGLAGGLGTTLTRTSNIKEEPKALHSSGLGGLGNRGRSVLAPGALHLRPAQVCSPLGCSGPCVPACCCADSQGRPRVGDQRVALGVPGRARTRRGGPGRSALPDSKAPPAAPPRPPGRGHTPYVWASETVLGDSFIDGSSFRLHRLNVSLLLFK